MGLENAKKAMSSLAAAADPIRSETSIDTNSPLVFLRLRPLLLGVLGYLAAASRLRRLPSKLQRAGIADTLRLFSLMTMLVDGSLVSGRMVN